MNEKIKYNGEECSFEEAIGKIRAVTINHEERLTKMESFLDKVKKYGWYAVFFIGAGFVQHPDTYRILITTIIQAINGQPPTIE